MSTYAAQPSNCMSGYKGVYYGSRDNGKWKVQATIGKGKKVLGTFADINEAIMAAGYVHKHKITRRSQFPPPAAPVAPVAPPMAPAPVIVQAHAVGNVAQQNQSSTLLFKVNRVKSALDLDTVLSMPAAINTANALMQLPSQGSLPSQADALLQALGV